MSSDISQFLSLLSESLPLQDAFNPKKGTLSNRKPKTREMVYGRKALIGFLELFSDAIVIGVGKTSAYCLDPLDTDFYSVRHPAQGGAPEFRSQFFQILDRTRSS